MKLQRLKSRTVGPKAYYKWLVNLPGKLVDELGWQADDELTVEKKDGGLTIRKN